MKRLKRLAWGAARRVEVKLPLEGAASIMSASPDIDGAIVEPDRLDARARDLRGRRDGQGDEHRPAAARARSTRPPISSTTEVKVKSHDGALVPLSIIAQARA